MCLITEHAVGIIVPQICFGAKGKMLQVLQRLYVPWAYPFLLHAIPISIYILIDPLYRALQFMQLNPIHCFPISTLHCSIPNHLLFPFYFSSRRSWTLLPLPSNRGRDPEDTRLTFASIFKVVLKSWLIRLLNSSRRLKSSR